MCDSDLAVRLVGGSQPSTGIVEVFLKSYGEWGILCSTPWTITEADTVCRQYGYGGGLTNEGVIPKPFNQSGIPVYRGSVDCSTGDQTARGYTELFGCQKELVKGDEACEFPNSVSCTRHHAGMYQTYLETHLKKFQKFFFFY